MKKFMPYFLFILLVVITLCRDIDTKGDFGWQVKSGQWMVENGQILDDDIFSWVDSTKRSTWYNQEWIAEIIMYISSLSVVTYFGLGVLLAVLISSLGYITAVRNMKCSRNTEFIIFVFLILIFKVFFIVRPYLFGLLMFLLEILVFERLRERPGSNIIYALIPMGIFWINVHGGSANLLYIIGAIYIFAGSFSFKFGKIEGIKQDKKYRIRYLAVIIMSTVGMLLNPYGLKMLYYPYVNMADSQMTSNITEWHSPVINNFPDVMVYVLIILVLGSMFIQEEGKVDFRDLCLTGFAIIMSLISFRHVMFLWALSFLVLFKYIPKVKKSRINKDLYIYVFSFVFTLFLVVNGGNKIQYKEYLSENNLSIIQNYSPKRIFNEYNVGGYLILKGIPVFIDGRYELYRDIVFKDYECIKNMNENAERLIAEYGFDSFLVYEGTDIERYLGKNSAYQKLYKDKNENLCFYIDKSA